MTDQDTNNVKKMRETIDRLTEENTDLKAFRKETVIKDSGLQGPALKAVLKDIDRGDYSGKMDVDSIQEYATSEYDWTPDATSTDTATSETDVTQDLVDEGETELTELDENGQAPPVTDIADHQNKAQVDGRHADAVRLGVESQMEQLMGLSNS